ncbi:hypothetical protein D3C80_1647650 [compost metagenome]
MIGCNHDHSLFYQRPRQPGLAAIVATAAVADDHQWKMSGCWRGVWQSRDACKYRPAANLLQLALSVCGVIDAGDQWAIAVIKRLQAAGNLPGRGGGDTAKQQTQDPEIFHNYSFKGENQTMASALSWRDLDRDPGR